MELDQNRRQKFVYHRPSLPNVLDRNLDYNCKLESGQTLCKKKKIHKFTNEPSVSLMKKVVKKTSAMTFVSTDKFQFVMNFQVSQSRFMAFIDV